MHSLPKDPHRSDDRWHVSAAGIPTKAIGYLFLTFVVLHLAVTLPATLIWLVLFGFPTGVLLVFVVFFAGPLWFFGAPLAVTWAAITIRRDGRSGLRWLRTWWDYRRRAKRTSNGRTLPDPATRTRIGGKLRVRWDVTAPRLQRVRIAGPARVRFASPVRFSLRSGGWRAHPDAHGRAGEYEVPAGESLEVRP